MKTMKVLCISICCILLFPTVVTATFQIIPKGKVYIQEVSVPSEIILEQPFTASITIRNERFIPIKIQLTITLLDGILQTIASTIGEHKELRIPARTTITIPMDCYISSGATDWFKEKYNLQATLQVKRRVIGWITQDISSVQAVHLRTPLQEKAKIHLVHVDSPETLSKNQHTFTVYAEVTNKGNFDMSIYSKVNLVIKPSLVPEMEQLSVPSGFVSEKYELGRSDVITIKKDQTLLIPIPCYIRSHHQHLKRFSFETQVFVNIQGNHFLVDTYQLQGIQREQTLIQQHGVNLGILIVLVLVLLVLLALLYRIIYPAYYIKRYKLHNEKQKIERHKNFHT